MSASIISVQVPASLAASCKCSEERVMRTLRLLPRTEIEDIMEKHEDIEVKCEFCGKRYNMTPEEIKANLDATSKGTP